MSHGWVQHRAKSLGDIFDQDCVFCGQSLEDTSRDWQPIFDEIAYTRDIPAPPGSESFDGYHQQTCESIQEMATMSPVVFLVTSCRDVQPD